MFFVIQTVVPLILCVALLLAWVVETIWIVMTGTLAEKRHSHTSSPSSLQADAGDISMEKFVTQKQKEDSKLFQRRNKVVPVNHDNDDDVESNRDTDNKVPHNQQDEAFMLTEKGANALDGVSNGSHATDKEELHLSAKEEHYSKKYFALFVYLTYLVLPSVTTTIFLAFPTINVNPSGVKGLPYASVYLASDYRIEFGSERCKLAQLWAIVMIFVYPVGIPVRLLSFSLCVFVFAHALYSSSKFHEWFYIIASLSYFLLPVVASVCLWTLLWVRWTDSCCTPCFCTCTGHP